MKKLFDEIPHIESARLCLRRLVDSDLPALAEMTRSEAVYRYLPTFLFEKQFDDLQEMLSRLYGECFASKESLILCVDVNGRGFAGLIELYALKESQHAVSLGCRLAQDFWGNGYASESVRAVAAYLFSQTDTELITISILPENRSSALSAEKLGFTRFASGVPEDWGYAALLPTDKWFLKRA